MKHAGCDQENERLLELLSWGCVTKTKWKERHVVCADCKLNEAVGSGNGGNRSCGSGCNLLSLLQKGHIVSQWKIA